MQRHQIRSNKNWNMDIDMKKMKDKMRNNKEEKMKTRIMRRIIEEITLAGIIFFALVGVANGILN